MERSGDDITRKLGVIKMRHTHHRLGYSPILWSPEDQRFTIVDVHSTVTTWPNYEACLHRIPMLMLFCKRLIESAVQSIAELEDNCTAGMNQTSASSVLLRHLLHESR